MKLLALNNIEPPVKSNFISFSVDEFDGQFILYKIVENFYPHPEAPEHALISTIEKEIVNRVKKGTPEAVPLHLFESLLRTTQQLYNIPDSTSREISKEEINKTYSNYLEYWERNSCWNKDSSFEFGAILNSAFEKVLTFRPLTREEFVVRVKLDKYFPKRFESKDLDSWNKEI